MSIEITDEGLEKRRKTELKKMVDKFKKQEVSEQQALENVSASFTLLKDSCGDLPLSEGGLECLVIATEAENEWQKSIWG